MAIRTKKPKARKQETPSPIFQTSDDCRLLLEETGFFSPMYLDGPHGKKHMCPKYVIIHYTAGRGYKETVARFADPKNRVSAHLVIGREGQITQMVPFDRAAWHAGADSVYLDSSQSLFPSPPLEVRHLNFHSIGIELDNYGPLTLVGGKWKTWFGRTVDQDEVFVSSSGRSWHAYTEIQLLIVEKLCVLFARDIGIDDILGHSDVKSTKRDPGPAFPMVHIRAAVFGRDDEEPEEQEQDKPEPSFVAGNV